MLRWTSMHINHLITITWATNLCYPLKIQRWVHIVLATYSSDGDNFQWLHHQREHETWYANQSCHPFSVRERGEEQGHDAKPQPWSLPLLAFVALPGIPCDSGFYSVAVTLPAHWSFIPFSSYQAIVGSEGVFLLTSSLPSAVNWVTGWPTLVPTGPCYGQR